MREVISKKIFEAENSDWKTYKDIVTSAATDTLGFKKKNTPWCTESVKTAVGEKMRWIRKSMKRRRPENRLE